MRFLMLHPQRQLRFNKIKMNQVATVIIPQKNLFNCCVNVRMLIWGCLELTILYCRSLNFVQVPSRNAYSFFATFVVYLFSKP